MSPAIDLLFFTSVVLPPAAVVLGALTLLWPRQTSTSTVAASQSHAHAH